MSGLQHSVLFVQRYFPSTTLTCIEKSLGGERVASTLQGIGDGSRGHALGNRLISDFKVLAFTPISFQPVTFQSAASCRMGTCQRSSTVPLRF